jgi:hypothetical protein
VVDCWEAAKKRITERDSLEAEQRASRLPVTIPVTEHVAMRLDFEKEHGRKKNDEYPAAPYLEARFEQIDTGDLLAENLQDVVSRDEHQDDPQGASIDKDGRLRLKTVMKKVSLPRNSEELRSRIKIMGITYTLAKKKNPNRQWLQDATPDIWVDHLDYMLGKRVYGFSIKKEGEAVHSPSWQLVLSYEHQIRKEALRLVMLERKTLRDALEASRKDHELREEHFTTPVAMEAAYDANRRDGTRQRQTPSFDRGGPYENPNPGNPGKGKGKRGKGKGKKGRKGGKGVDPSMHGNTPDGRQICFAWNSPTERCAGGCGRVHVCRICFGAHPAHMHASLNRRAEPAAGGAAEGGGAAPGQTF